MNQLILDAFALVFNQPIVSVALVSFITFVVAVIVVFGTLMHWGR